VKWTLAFCFSDVGIGIGMKGSLCFFFIWGVLILVMWLQENTASVSKQVLSSVLAAGLAITIAGSAFAASGPGGDGAERTARKADQLLQGADSLIKNDSPQRFGPERGFGNGTSAEDIARFSQK
jgi:hypothetical protein